MHGWGLTKRDGGAISDINPRAERWAELRQPVRDLCRKFDSQYWQEVDAVAAYPEAFVGALTEAGGWRR